MTEMGQVLFVLAAQVTIPVAAGLLLSRRRDPAAACGPLLVAAAAALLLTPLAFIPRPAWPAFDRPDPPPQQPAANPQSIDTVSSGSTLPGGIDLLGLLHVTKPQSSERPTSVDAWRWLSIGLIGLAILGLSQLFLGVLSTMRAVNAASAVGDPGLVALAAELRAALGCRRAFAIRESDRVGTAATAGWLRPVILVSPTWRLWSAAERGAVLAHEIAHVARGDFAARLVAQLAVAIHGYHPLLRWLAARLEVRQEMAADARAADRCGGRTAYLKCLAALALRADARPLGAAPTFLSRPRTLLRRIAMLRVTEDTPPRRRWPAAIGVALFAAAALTLHGSTPDALAGPVVRAKAEAPAERPPLDVSFVLPSDKPDDVGVYAVRVGALCRTPGMKKIAETYGETVKTVMGDPKKTHFELTDVEQVSGRVTLTHDPSKPAPNRALMMSLTSIRMEKDFDWVKQLQVWGEDWKEYTHAGVKYYSAKMSVPILGFKDTTTWFYLPDSRTMVLEGEENIKKLIDAKGKPSSAAWAADWKAVEGGMVAVVLPDVKGKLAPKMTADKSDDQTKQAVIATLSAICKKTSRAAVGFDLYKGCCCKLRLACPTADDAIDVDAGCQGITKLARAAIEADPEDPKDPVAKAGKKLSTCLVRGVEFGKTVDHVVEVRTSTPDGLADLLKAFSSEK